MAGIDAKTEVARQPLDRLQQLLVLFGWSQRRTAWARRHMHPHAGRRSGVRNPLDPLIENRSSLGIRESNREPRFGAPRQAPSASVESHLRDVCVYSVDRRCLIGHGFAVGCMSRRVAVQLLQRQDAAGKVPHDLLGRDLGAAAAGRPTPADTDARRRGR